MKKPSIKWEGVKYSGYSERGRAVKKYKRANKREKTHVPVSLMGALAVLPLVAQAFA